MARGYQRGREHIARLNRENAHIEAIKQAVASGQKCLFVFKPTQVGRYAVERGPYLSPSDADIAAMRLGVEYTAASDEFSAKHDPEGVSRLKANPKL